MITASWFFFVWAAWLWPGFLLAQDGSTILRDLTRIPSSVKRFDRQSIQLDNGQLVTWDEVLRADAGTEQERFDRLFRKIGLPLFRIRTRLLKEDIGGAYEKANALRQSTDVDLLGDRTAFLVYRAIMWGELQQGNSGEAIVAFLKCRRAQSKLTPEDLERFSRLVIPARDLETGFSNEFLPLSFDVEQARNGLSDLEEMGQASGGPAANAFQIYRAALAVAAGDLNKATQALAETTNVGDSQIDHWRTLISAQIRIARGQVDFAQSELETQLPQMSPAARAAAYYLRGRAYEVDPNSISETDATLSLLTVPAVAKLRWPNLSAAALFTAARISRRANLIKESEILTRQLLTDYPNTYHGRKVLSNGRKIE